MKAIERKKKIVEELVNLIKSYSTVGVADITGVPANVMQKLRSELSGVAKIKVAKKRMIKFAFEKCGIDMEVDGQPALVLSSENPFKLSMLLRKTKSSAPAKPGTVVDRDVVVPAGPTDIPPGPAISTLTKVGIPAKVEGGKITVLRDFTVCKKGEKVTEDVAAALNLLKIKPIEIGLELISAYEGGTVYDRSVLSVDPESYLKDLAEAKARAVRLAVEIAYPTPETVEPLLIKAHTSARALGTEAGVLIPGVIEDVLISAKSKAEALNSIVRW